MTKPQLIVLVMALVVAFSLGFLTCCGIFMRKYRELKISIDETNAQAKEMWINYEEQFRRGVRR